MARRALGLLLIMLCSSPLLAQTRPTPSEPKLTAQNDLRFDEDGSVLRGAGPSGAADLWDPVKFIPLTEDEHVWLTFAGQVRERQEYVGQFQFGESSPDQSDAYLLSRIRLSADLHASRYFRIFAEAKSALATNRDLTGGDSASFVDELDLQNGFADMVIPLGAQSTFTLRAGRQELLFGVQRLIGASDYASYNHFLPGDFIRATGPARGSDYVYAALQFTF